jgi:two-component system KDP operon response regulator KdpE
MDGVAVVRALREWTRMPIIVLSGRTQSQAKVSALDAGADDYVTKPFSIEELVARVRAAVRRAVGNDEEQPPVRMGHLLIDVSGRRVTVDAPLSGVEKVIRLTRTEWQLLAILVRNPGRLVTQRELIRALRGSVHDDAAHYLRQYMAQLRRKLEPNPARPRYLLTEPGMGYRFQP